MFSLESVLPSRERRSLTTGRKHFATRSERTATAHALYWPGHKNSLNRVGGFGCGLVEIFTAHGSICHHGHYVRLDLDDTAGNKKELLFTGSILNPYGARF